MADLDKKICGSPIQALIVDDESFKNSIDLSTKQRNQKQPKEAEEDFIGEDDKEMPMSLAPNFLGSKDALEENFSENLNTISSPFNQDLKLSLNFGAVRSETASDISIEKPNNNNTNKSSRSNNSKRNQNYSNQEKEVLLSLVKHKLNIIEPANVDSDYLSKNNIEMDAPQMIGCSRGEWEEIALNYNYLSSKLYSDIYMPRTAQTLRLCWKNMKAKAKKELVSYLKNLPDENPDDEKLKSYQVLVDTIKLLPETIFSVPSKRLIELLPFYFLRHCGKFRERFLADETIHSCNNMAHTDNLSLRISEILKKERLIKKKSCIEHTVDTRYDMQNTKNPLHVDDAGLDLALNTEIANKARAALIDFSTLDNETKTLYKTHLSLLIKETRQRIQLAKERHQMRIEAHLSRCNRQSRLQKLNVVKSKLFNARKCKF